VLLAKPLGLSHIYTVQNSVGSSVVTTLHSKDLLPLGEKFILLSWFSVTQLCPAATTSCGFRVVSPTCGCSTSEEATRVTGSHCAKWALFLSFRWRWVASWYLLAREGGPPGSVLSGHFPLWEDSSVEPSPLLHTVPVSPDHLDLLFGYLLSYLSLLSLFRHRAPSSASFSWGQLHGSSSWLSMVFGCGGEATAWPKCSCAR
jgi:hypothetical protein